MKKKGGCKCLVLNSKDGGIFSPTYFLIGIIVFVLEVFIWNISLKKQKVKIELSYKLAQRN